MAKYTKQWLLPIPQLSFAAQVSGPVVGTEKAMSMCKKANMPRMIVINQMDRENANFDKAIEGLHDKFGVTCVPIQLPIIEKGAYVGYVDLTTMTAKRFDGKGEKEIDIPASLAGRAEELREALMEAAAEGDEELMMTYLDTMELSQEEIIRGLNLGIAEGAVTPVCCVSALLNTGVHTLMNNLVHYMPTADKAPIRPAVNARTGEAVEIKRDGKFAAQIMKTVADPFVGKISIMKVYAGSIDATFAAYNPNAEKSEKSGAVYMMRGKNLINVDKLCAGDIGAMAKLQFTNTGDTLTDPQNPSSSHPSSSPLPAFLLQFPQRNRAKRIKSLQASTASPKKIPLWRSRRMQKPAMFLSKVSAKCILTLSAQSSKTNSRLKQALQIPVSPTVRLSAPWQRLKVSIKSRPAVQGSSALFRCASNPPPRVNLNLLTQSSAA